MLVLKTITKAYKSCIGLTVGHMAYVAVCWSDNWKKMKLDMSWLQKVPTNIKTNYLCAVMAC